MISLYDLLEAANGQLFGEPHAHLFSEAVLIPAAVSESSLFVVLDNDVGAADAAVREALRRGAAGVLAARPPEIDADGLSVILVKNPATALAQWATHVLSRTGLPVIAVAGVSGRAVALHALEHILRERVNLLVSAPDATGRLAIPLTLSRLAPEHQAMALAVDITRPGEMAEIAGVLQPRMAILTHAGIGPYGQFESAAQYAAELGLLLDYLHDDGLAVLNYDDDLIRSLARRGRGHTLMVSASGQFGADVLAHHTVLGPTRTGFDLRYFDQKLVGRWTPLLGRDHLYGALAALALGEAFNVSIQDGLRALTTITPLPGHMRPLPGVGGALLIDDSSEAEAQSTLAAMDWLQEASAGTARPILLLADLDAPGAGGREHRLIGQRASETAEAVVTLGPEAAQAGRAALDTGLDAGQVIMAYNPLDAVTALRGVVGLTERDLVLIKGGAAARLERVTRALLESPADADALPRARLLDGAISASDGQKPSWVEIDLEALAGNVSRLKALVGPEVALFAVVKADAYGHGAVAIARTALQNGAHAVAVANLGEALALREAGIQEPILLLSAVPASEIREVVRHNLTVTLYDLGQAQAFDRAARDAGGPVQAHVKVDTGMGRMGVLAGETMAFFRQLARLPSLTIEGLYTHFSRADDDPDYTAAQVRVFKDVLAPLRAAGYRFRSIHAANSAGTLASSANHFTAVRVGLAMYGLSPFPDTPLPEGFRPVMRWKTTIGQVKTLPAGHPVGYGNTYITSGPERIAVLPVGYADGVRRAPQHQGGVLVHGQWAPILGRVSMEKTIISVDHIPEARMGDEVVLLGEQDGAAITAADIAARWGTISYEVVCSVLARQPR